MPRRPGFTLVEIVVATALLTTSLLIAARVSALLGAAVERSAGWRTLAGEVEDLLRRFAMAPCALAPSSPAELPVGDLTFQWRVEADSGRLMATAWPGDAPTPIRRGALRSVLPCA